MYPPFPPGFQFGPFSLRWYGLIVVTAIVVGALIAGRFLERQGQDKHSVWNLLLWVVPPAVIGARLYSVFIQPPNGSTTYLTHPLEILAIWQGGIHMYGALLGGGIALLIYLSVKKLPVLIYLDAVALALPIGQALGRLGNFMNQELYGPPTTLPWGLRIDPAYRVAPYTNLSLYPASLRFQPLFLYEMFWNVLGFILIFWLARRFAKSLRAGDLLLMYLIWYPLVRFFLEFSRIDSSFFPGTRFNSVHIVSAIVVIISVVLLVRRHRDRASLLAWSTLSKVRPLVRFQGEEEGEIGEGLDMLTEYTFLKKDRHSVVKEYAEETEEEYEGMEDFEIGVREELVIEDFLLEEGEENSEEEEASEDVLEENEEASEDENVEEGDVEEEAEEEGEDEEEESNDEETGEENAEAEEGEEVGDDSAENEESGEDEGGEDEESSASEDAAEEATDDAEEGSDDGDSGADDSGADDSGDE